MALYQFACPWSLFGAPQLVQVALDKGYLCSVYQKEKNRDFSFCNRDF